MYRPITAVEAIAAVGALELAVVGPRPFSRPAVSFCRFGVEGFGAEGFGVGCLWRLALWTSSSIRAASILRSSLRRTHCRGHSTINTHSMSISISATDLCQISPSLTAQPCHRASPRRPAMALSPSIVAIRLLQPWAFHDCALVFVGAYFAAVLSLVFVVIFKLLLCDRSIDLSSCLETSTTLQLGSHSLRIRMDPAEGTFYRSKCITIAPAVRLLNLLSTPIAVGSMRCGTTSLPTDERCVWVPAGQFRGLTQLQSNESTDELLYFKADDSAWSAPMMASQLGQIWLELEPAWADDGDDVDGMFRRVIAVSSRPVADGLSLLVTISEPVGQPPYYIMNSSAVVAIAVRQSRRTGLASRRHSDGSSHAAHVVTARSKHVLNWSAESSAEHELEVAVPGEVRYTPVGPALSVQPHRKNRPNPVVCGLRWVLR